RHAADLLFEGVGVVLVPADQEARAERADQTLPVLAFVVHGISPLRRGSQSARPLSFVSVGQSKPELRIYRSSTSRSRAAPGVVPENTWLNRKRVRGWRAARACASSQLVWPPAPSGPVASVIATSAPRTSSSSGGVAVVSPA